MDSFVNVKYFAMLRDRAGIDEENVSLESGDSAASIYLRLAEKYKFALSLKDLRFAINDEFGSSDTELKAGDSLVFIPPVAGG